MLNKTVYIFYPLKLHWYFTSYKKIEGVWFKGDRQIIKQPIPLGTTAIGMEDAPTNVEIDYQPSFTSLGVALGGRIDYQQERRN